MKNNRENSFSAFRPIKLELINIAEVKAKDITTAVYARHLKAMARHSDALVCAEERRRLIEAGRHR